MRTVEGSPLSDVEWAGIDGYWRAANYLSVGQIYLLDNPMLTEEQSANFNELQLVLQAILDSEPVCYGDGNLDKVVNQLDFVGTHIFSGQPSVFDMNEDGTTDAWDTDCVLSNFGNVCTPFNSGAPCPTPAQHQHAATNGRR